MPRNNKKTMVPNVEMPKAASTPAPSAPAIKATKNLQDALIDGFKNPAQWAMDFLELEPYEAQAAFLQNTRDVVEANFVAGNRVGKTWSCGPILLWRAFYRYIPTWTRPEKQTPHNTYKAVSMSLTHDQAKLSWNYALNFASNSKRFKPFLEDVVHSPFPSMQIKTKNEKGEWVRSEVWSRSLAKGGIHLLGHSIGFALVDECAYIKNYQKIEDEVIRMRLADQGGALFRISTPNGRNHFYDYYLKGLPGHDGKRDPRYYSHRITSWENPYISRAYLEEQKRRMLPEFYQQNIMADFISLSDFFKLDAITGLYDDQDYELPQAPVKGARYVLGADLGSQIDPTIVFVLRIDEQKDEKGRTLPQEMVYVGKLQNASWRAVREYIAGIWGTYKPVASFIDSTGVGAPVVEALISEDKLTGVTPFVFSAASKPEALSRLQDAVQRRQFVFPYTSVTKELINQLSFYRLDDKKISQDFVMALALVNLAYWSTQHNSEFGSEIPDDLLALPILRGGRVVPADLIEDPDLAGGWMEFTLNPLTGIYTPKSEEGDNLWVL